MRSFWNDSLLAFGAGLLAAAAVLFVAYGTSEAHPLPRRSALVVSDSDSVRVDVVRLLDSLVVEALNDTTDGVPPDTGRASRYFPLRRTEAEAARVVLRAPVGLIRPPAATYWRQDIRLDSTDLRYTARETVGGLDVRVPVEVTYDDFRVAQRQAAIAQNFRELARQRANRLNNRRGGIGLTIQIPGGDRSAFSTIFGKNEVDLRVNGTANINLGFAYQTNELQQAATGQSGRLDPDFGQELGLGITGTIGDKLKIGVNYDTQNQFDFENQVKLTYEGYDDDIIQRIEAGNVFLQTPSDLIRGGQRLFGILTALRFGNLDLTMVASQQDAQSDELNISGGSQTTNFDLSPAEYDDNAHFFLASYFRNNWNTSHASPPAIRLAPNFQNILDIDVYIRDNTVVGNTQSNEFVDAVALVDLAEPPALLAGPDAYTTPFLTPSPDIDQYSDADLQLLRESASSVNLETAFGLASSDFERSRFRRLREGQDFTLDRARGFLSLTRALAESEALAIAYQYRRTAGNTAADTALVVNVGDFGQGSSGAISGQRIILKLIRGGNPTPTDASWGLTLRNIYRIGGRNLNPNEFNLQVNYRPSGRPPQRTLPGVDIGQQQTLLQTTGLDRLDASGQPTQPDDAFDFVPGYTLDPTAGRVIFPFLEPFGARMRAVLGGDVPGLDIRFTDTDEADALADFAFDTLYSVKADVARSRFPEIANYRISGSFRSSVQETYSLGFSVVEGSVRVTANNVPLSEGIHYTVDYATGEVVITDPTYLTPGQNIKIDFERNQFAAIGRKTLLGLRADYTVRENVGLGATWMRLSERPLVDKYRVGEEPISNTIFGVDGRYEADPRWLTRLIDALPLIQTRAPSSVKVQGEFAQLLPGHPQTFAFDQERESLARLDRDFNADELRGISFIDDFEGSENSYSLTQPGAWRLAAAPLQAGPAGTVTDPTLVGLSLADTTGQTATDPRLANNWRGLTAWYTLQPSLYTTGIVRQVGETRATRQLDIRDLFDRDIGSGSPFLNTFDVYFDPARRGPYNVNRELLSGFKARPQDTWGGIVQRIPDGYTDFDARNNIEFVELLVTPFGGRTGTETVTEGSALYVDLGQLSEDVIPNREFNREDGLVEIPLEGAGASIDAFGRLPTGQPNTTVDLDNATSRTEDLGLDGLRNTRRADGGTPYERAEDQQFRPFLFSLAASNDPDALLAAEDPAGDDYHHFEESGFFSQDRFPGGATVQERFSRFFPGTELNAFESQSQLARAGQPGNARQPDTEDLDGNQDVDLADRFFRYTIPLDSARIGRACETPEQADCNPYFVNQIAVNGRFGRETWYLLRIPVRDETRREAFGGILDFASIQSIRLWTEGHDRPVTLRFASLELVGSQWLKSTRVGLTDDPIVEGGQAPALQPQPQLFISTINTEENRAIYTTPRGTIVNRTRDVSGQLLATREQALVFRVDSLGAGQWRGLYRSYTNRLDLTKYTNLRMFVHGQGYDRFAGDDVRVFVRLGTNETTDYYEYEAPLYAFDPALGTDPDSLWQSAVTRNGGVVDRNSVNIVLSALNQLKVERDQQAAALPTLGPEDRYQGVVAPPNAPAGARLYIRGTPSVREISTIVIGLRNAGVQPVNVTAWFNELRASGYDEGSGWSAYGLTQLRLADLADVNLRMSRQTDGFGELSAGLGERTFRDEQAVSFSTNVNVNKVLPERYGWRIPVNVSVQRSESTPRYSPRQGDLRVSDLIAQAETDPTLSDAERRTRIREIREESESVSLTRSGRISLAKSNSRSPWLRYTLDGFSVAYSQTYSDRRSPTERFSTSLQWNGSLNYRLSVPRPKTVRPFWFVGEVPVVGRLGGLRLNVLPQSFGFSADASRARTANQQRPSTALDTAVVRVVPEVYVNPIRANHAFDHGRNVEFAYNPFTFLTTSYRSDVNQTLSTIGIDRFQNTFYFNPVGNPNPGARGESQEYLGLSPDEVAALVYGDGVDADSARDFGVTFYTRDEQRIRPVGRVLSDVFSGARRLQTDSYNQSLTATLTPRFDRVQWLRWFRPNALSYSTAYTWNFQPLTGDTGEDAASLASASTNVTLRTGLSLRVQEFWRQFGFYKKLEEDQRRTDAQRQAARRQRDQEAQRRRQLEDAARERARQGLAPDSAAAAALAAADTTARRRPALPNVGALGRRLFLAFTGVSDFTLTISNTQRSDAAGIDGSSWSLWDALQGDGPSLGYRLGLDRRFERAFEQGQTFVVLPQDQLSDNYDVGARTSLSLSQDLRVDLNWTLNWGSRERYAFTLPSTPGGLPLPQAPDESGNGRATVWGLTGSYEDLLERHRQRLLDDLDGATPQRLETDALTNNALLEDFRDVFTRNIGFFGPNGTFAWPLPNWTVSYNGLAKWPLIRRIAQTATLRHGYAASYDSDFRSDAAAAGITTPVARNKSLALDGTTYSLFDTPDFLRGERVTLSQRFQPLVGVNLTLKGGIQGDVQFNRSRSFFFTAASSSLKEDVTNEVTLRMNYAKSGMRLPFFRRINNNVRLTMTMSRAYSLTQNFQFETDFRNYIQGLALLPRQPQASTRLTLEPRVSYTISNQVTMDVFVRYTSLDSEGSQIPSSSNLNGGFNFRVAFSN